MTYLAGRVFAMMSYYLHLRVLQRRKIVALVLTIVSLCLSDCIAHSAENPSTKYKVIAVSAWVLHGATKAHPDTIEADASRLLGMGNSDLDGRAAGWANERNDVLFFFVTFPDRSDVVLVRRDDKLGRKIYWRIKDGAFSRTALFQGGIAAVVSGEAYDEGGMAILDFFYNHLPTSRRP